MIHIFSKIKIPIFVFLVMLSACTIANANTPPPPAPAPTDDINLIRTQAAQTVIAQITQQAPQLPASTSTPLPPPPPPLVTSTIPSVSLATPLPTIAPSGGVWVVMPTITKTYYVDSAALVSQSIEDGLIVAPGQDLPIKWVIRNNGARDWNTQFYFRWMGGTLTTGNTITNLGSGVPRGGQTEFSVFFEAPNEPGIHYANYCLYNDDAICILKFYFSVQVPE